MSFIQEQFFDIGANLTHKSFKSDIDKVIVESTENGVKRMSVTGSCLADSILAAEIAEEYPDICVSTAGIHPHNAKEYSPELFSEIKDLLSKDLVKCIGETGLDFNRNFSSPEQQIKSFEAHLELSLDKNLPLFLHERDAHQKFVEITSAYISDLPKSVVHCFTGDKDSLMKYLDMGFYIGITGWLCDERRGSHLKELVPLIPLEKLMIETDSPYLLPRDMGLDNSERNEPKYLPHIAKRISEIRNESEELIFSSIYMNSLDFFDISI
ncbi:MAG: hydrolase TatD [Gammaproteobacteria bacterium]|nr:MAG: hydrolase TatD [Gammaproteobacteria bacterium]